jgi:mannitol-1-phosphate 5-dehydrogenase
MKKAIVFGAGNIGRGFIAQLFSESGYFVTFVDVDNLVLECLNLRGHYRLQTVFNDEVHDYTIGPVAAIHANDTEAVAEAFAEADIGATAVGAKVLPYLVDNIIAGLAARKGRKMGPLNIILCENLKGASAEMTRLVNQKLPEHLAGYAESHLGFVNTVIGRMVPLQTPEMREQDPTLVRVEPYKELPVDRTLFKGEIPEISAMMPEDHFERYTARKLYIHNAGHALLAYAGYQKGFEFGWEALEDGEIRAFVRKGMEESRDGIVNVLGADKGWLDEHIEDLLGRFRNRALGDTIFRLGRDPVRKLGPKDRLVSAARCALKGGVIPHALAEGIALGFRFDPQGDPVAVQLQADLKQNGLESTLRKVCGIDPDEELGKLVCGNISFP